MNTPRCFQPSPSGLTADWSDRFHLRRHGGCPASNHSYSSAKCKSVRKLHGNLPATPVALTSASKYLQMLPGPPGALQSAPRQCKSILRTLRAWTIRIVKSWSSWDLRADLWETSRAAETTAQLCRRLGAVFSQQWFLGFYKHKAFHWSYWSLLQSQDSLPHDMACII